jgi:hypothetical protein
MFSRWNENLKQWKVVEGIAFFLLVPLLLIAVFLLPPGIRETYFTLHPKNPTLPTLLLYDFNHANENHIEGNLISYLLVMFLIFNFESNKSRFYVSIIYCFIIIPIILALMAIALIPNLSDLGFSGTIAALMGYLVIVIYTFIKTTTKISLTPQVLMLIFLFNVLFAGLFAGLIAGMLAMVHLNDLLWPSFLGLVLLIILTLYLEMEPLGQFVSVCRHYLEKGPPGQYIQECRNRNIRFSRLLELAYLIVLSILSVYLVLFAFVILIPNNIVVDGNLTDIAAHYFAYMLVFLPYLLWGITHSSQKAG